MADQMQPAPAEQQAEQPGTQPGEGVAKLQQMIGSIAEGMSTVSQVLSQGEGVNPQGLEQIDQALQMFQDGVLIAIGEAPAQQPSSKAVPAPSPEGVPV